MLFFICKDMGLHCGSLLGVLLFCLLDGSLSSSLRLGGLFCPAGCVLFSEFGGLFGLFFFCFGKFEHLLLLLDGGVNTCLFSEDSGFGSVRSI
jgi:hypothetical protein